MIDFSLIILVPILIILSPVFNLLSFKLGEIDINLSDLILLITIILFLVRYLFVFTSLKTNYFLSKINQNILQYIVILFFTTFIYYLIISEDYIVAKLVSLTRFIIQIIIYYIISHKIPNNLQKIKNNYIYFNILGYLVLFSSWLSIFLFYFTGEKLGEIQSNQNGVRYFGLIGDQLGFIGLIFIFISLMIGAKINAVIWGITVIATGTRGAIISLVMGLIIYFLPKLPNFLKKNWSILAQTNNLIIVLSLVLVYLIFYNYLHLQINLILEIFNNTLSRIINMLGDDFSGTQRKLTWQIATNVFLNNPLIGVGYSGFRFVALKYGAEELFTGYDVTNSTANASNQYLQVATDAGLIGIMGFISLFSSILKVLKIASYCPIPELSKFFIAGRIWLWSLLIGNQTAAWFVPGSLISYLLWLILGMAAATVATGSDVSQVTSQRKPINYRF
ncbi:MAG: O-antigen ligase family protein [candidate division WOR-3 bacterium]